MAPVESEPSSSCKGMVDGIAVDFALSAPPNPILTWSDAATGTSHQLHADRVVGLDRVTPGSQARSIFYVDGPSEPEEDKALATSFLKSLTVLDPPEQLLSHANEKGTFLSELEHSTQQSNTEAPPPLHVIISVASGGRHALTYFDNLVAPLLKHINATSYTLHKTTSADTIAQLTRDIFRPAALAGTKKSIILLAGDGGILDIVNSLLDGATIDALPTSYAKPSIAVLPLGTGNALAHSSGVTHDRTLGLSTLYGGSPAPLPLFTVHFDPPAQPVIPPTPDNDDDSTAPRPAAPVSYAAGAVVFSWALHAALVADSDTPAYRELGAARFQAAAKENFFPADGGPPHAYRGTLSTLPRGDAEHADGGHSKGASGESWTPVPTTAHRYVLATLTTRLERAFTISPASAPLDGVLRLVHIGGDVDGPRITALMQAGYAGGAHVREADVRYEAVAGVRVRVHEGDEGDAAVARAGGPGRWRRVCVDGKIFVVPREGVVEVRAPPAAGGGRDAAAVLDLVHLA